jgi:general secretion pathway protein A
MMDLPKIQALYGLKCNPFLPEVPIDALLIPPRVESFCFRLESLVLDGGFAMITGDPGMGKSVVLRILADRLSKIRDLNVGVITRPQSSMADFYREIGAIFGQSWTGSNRWGSFRTLRERWHSHIESTLFRPVLLIDEAQEIPSTVLNELRLLASTSFDSRSILTIVLSGDHRLSERFTGPDLLPLGSRIKTRYRAETATREELCAAIERRLLVCGNSTLMTDGLIHTVADHSAGNYRLLMQTCEEILAYGASRDVKQLDEKLFLELYQQQQPRPRRGAATRRS